MKDGILLCNTCRLWFPIDSFILELLIPAQSYQEDRKTFYRKFSKHFDRLHLKEQNASRTRSQQLAQQEHFDWYADNDVQNYGKYASSPFWKGVDSLMFSKWNTHIPPSSWILDMGCGQGRSTFQLTDMAKTIVAMDISKNMVREAYHTYMISRHEARIIFLVADATSLPFRNNSFHSVVSYGVLHHLMDPKKGFSEIHRVLKKTGTFYCLENNKSVFRIFFDLLQKIYPLWHEEAGPSPLLSRKEVESWHTPDSFRIHLSTSTFFPPHVIDLMPSKLAVKVLIITDSIAVKIPWLSHQGGLLEIRGQKLKLTARNKR